MCRYVARPPIAALACTIRSTSVVIHEKLINRYEPPEAGHKGQVTKGRSQVFSNSLLLHIPAAGGTGVLTVEEPVDGIPARVFGGIEAGLEEVGAAEVAGQMPSQVPLRWPMLSILWFFGKVFGGGKGTPFGKVFGLGGTERPPKTSSERLTTSVRV